MDDAIQTLDPRDPRAREALIGILGTTLAGLKQIDSSIVGGSNNLTANKTDINQFASILNAHPPQQAPQQAPQFVPQFIPQQAPQFALPVPVLEPVPIEDPNQLVFDFNKPITPTVVNDKLDIIINKINSLLEKFDS
jgi:hypothetical protein